MTRELVVERSAAGICAALMGDARLLEVSLADDRVEAVHGGVYLGRIRSIDLDLDAAFVDCGWARDGYLDGRAALNLSGRRRGTSIGRQLREGQAIIVQVRRAAEGAKGPWLTGDIALAGAFLRWHPRGAGVTLSPRLLRSPDADAARARGAALFPKGGVQLRAAATLASDADLLAEADRLGVRWRGLEQLATTARPPTRLDRDRDALDLVLAELASPEIDRIVVGDRILLAQLRAKLDGWHPPLIERLTVESRPLAATGALDQLSTAAQPEVALDGGGSVTIEATRALTAIDVDGGGRRALDANLGAAVEIARQLRLRRIGGTVVVDFVDLPTRAARGRVVDRLRDAFATDPAAVEVSPMSGLGLVAITRQYLGAGLASLLGRTCPVCAGSGSVAAADLDLVPGEPVIADVKR